MFRIKGDGDVQIGVATDPGNALRYVDVANYNSGAGAGSILRLLTLKSDDTSSTSADIVKYKTGGLVINNNDNLGTGFISFGTAKNGGATTERLAIQATGRIKVPSTTTTTVDNSAGTYTVDGPHLSIGSNDADALQIFHDSGNNNSFISEVGAGDLCVVTNGTNLYIQKDATSGSAEDMIHCIANGAVKLFYNGGATAKLETTDDGVKVNGALEAPSNPLIKTSGSTSFGSAGSLTTNTANVGISQGGAAINKGATSWTQTGSNAYTFVCPVDGVYVVHAHVSYGNIGGGRKIWVMSYTLGGGNLPLSSYVEIMDHNSQDYANFSYYDTYEFTAGTRVGMGKNGGSGTVTGQNFQWGIHLLQ